MYPDLEDTTSSRLAYRKSLPPSETMTNAILQIRQKFPITSFRPHLNYHECHMNLIINGKLNLPIKMYIFMRNYPKEKPLIYISKFVVHPLVTEYSCEVNYENVYPWKSHSSLGDLLSKIQGEFSNTSPHEKSDIDAAYHKLDEYQKNLESLRSRPGTQPPPLPQINLEPVLRAFEYQENLHAQCQEKASLYQITAKEYAENVLRIQSIGEKFGRGKILKEMEKEIEAQMEKEQYGGIDDMLRSYYESRKQYHRMKILKEKYLEI